MAPLKYNCISKRLVCANEDSVSLDDLAPRGCLSSPRRMRPTVSVEHARIPLSPLDTCVFVKHLSPCSAFWFTECPDAALLVASLRRTLRTFPIVAGRLRPASEPNPLGSEYEVLCDDSGIGFDVFSCSGVLSDFTDSDAHTQPRSNFKPATFQPTVHVQQMLKGEAPMARIRLTRLADGGAILAMTFSHIIVDGHSGLHFSYVWSREYSELTGTSMPGPKLPFGPPVFDRAVFAKAVALPEELPEEIITATAEMNAAGAQLRSAISGGMLRGRLLKMAQDMLWGRQATFSLRVSGAQVKAARAAAAAATGTSLSANDALLGITWATLRRARARGPEAPPRLLLPGDAAASSHFACQTIDLRRFLPIGDGYFGNTAWFVHMSAPGTARSPADFGAAVRASLSRFSDSALVFEQAAMLSQASKVGSAVSTDTLRTFMMPLFGDGMFSSWYAPHMWQFRFGGTPVHFHGGIFPQSPHGWCISAGRPGPDGPGPDGPDYVLHGTCRASALRKVVAVGREAIREAAGDA